MPILLTSYIMFVEMNCDNLVCSNVTYHEVALVADCLQDGGFLVFTSSIYILLSVSSY